MALLLIGTPRDSDYGRLVEDIAIRHRAGLLEVDGTGALEAHCRANEIGISPETVKSLLTERDPEHGKRELRGHGIEQEPRGS